MIVELLEEHGYTIQKELGQRGSRIVFLVNDKDGNPYVIKKINSINVSTIKHILNQVFSTILMSYFVAVKMLLKMQFCNCYECQFYVEVLQKKKKKNTNENFPPQKKEVEILKSLEHGYIVTYVDLFEGMFKLYEKMNGNVPLSFYVN